MKVLDVWVARWSREGLGDGCRMSDWSVGLFRE